ncbi:DUF4493 domain-containing protein [Zobellia roscoffensis]|uniref:leucine-rich repeat domain-containing protein n=1 Tax=Zobellia roscoffensis TaxID=2779508 RepID=UPI00188B89E5|nr:DUF4493 domain-containing protein [Zobellia roscoffensis]
MKTLKFLKFALCLLIPMFVVVSCNDEEDLYNYLDDGTLPRGSLAIQAFVKDEITISLTAKGLTLEEILNDTQVSVKDLEGNDVLDENYLDLPVSISLPVGEYRLFMERKGEEKPNFNDPSYVNTEFYSGGEGFSINEGDETEVNVDMVLNHIKVIVEFSDEILDVYPDIVADVFDPDPVDATGEAEKLSWTVEENKSSGYIYIDNFNSELKLSIHATESTGEVVTSTSTFSGASFNQKYHFFIGLSQQNDVADFSIHPELTKEEIIEELISFPLNVLSCEGSSMSDYEILKKLSEANIYEENYSILPWDLTDTSMLSWSGVTLDSEGRVIELDISGLDNGLSFIPDFWQLCKLKHLRIEEFSDEASLSGIGQLVNLESLAFGESNIDTLPSDIGQLKNLKSLIIGECVFYDVPTEIGQLIKLETLILYATFIEALPPEIGDLHNLKKLTLSRNSFGENLIPVEIGNLQSLEELELYSNGNTFTTIPTEIGQLANLKRLDLSENGLTSIPTELGQLSNLVFMDLRSNPVINIPQAVCDLDDADTEIHLDDGSFSPADVCN